MKTKAVVLLSGGQDSTTSLFWALKKFNDVVAIGFNYGQKHLLELQQARHIAQDIAKVPYKVFNIEGLLGGSSLTDHNIDHNVLHNDSGLPASFTAGRNILFLTIAAGYGHRIGASDIVTGVCETDYSGYPDCRREFIDAMQESLTLGVHGHKYAPHSFENSIKIHTPLMYLSKAETFKMANELGCLDVILSVTLTDYNGDTTMNEWGMGKEDNPASVLRAKGYREAKEKGWV
jgi:7-cyano-7-deazaguanine synthase